MNYFSKEELLTANEIIERYNKSFQKLYSKNLRLKERLFGLSPDEKRNVLLKELGKLVVKNGN